MLMKELNTIMLTKSTKLLSFYSKNIRVILCVLWV